MFEPTSLFRSLWYERIAKFIKDAQKDRSGLFKVRVACETLTFLVLTERKPSFNRQTSQIQTRLTVSLFPFHL